jgi:hypothetical protein
MNEPAGLARTPEPQGKRQPVDGDTIGDLVGGRAVVRRDDHDPDPAPGQRGGPQLLGPLRAAQHERPVVLGCEQDRLDGRHRGHRFRATSSMKGVAPVSR